MANSFDRIYAVVKKIPRGTVASYGQVALLAGNPRWARVVGYALHANPDPEGIPCYRVVTKDGRTSPAFAFGGADIQRALLEADGIEFTEDGRVDMAKYGWTGPDRGMRTDPVFVEILICLIGLISELGA